MNFPTSAKLSNFKRSFSTWLGSFQLRSVLSNFTWLFSSSDFPTSRSFQLPFPTTRIPIFWVIFWKFGIWSGFCFQKWHWVIHPKCNFFPWRSQMALDFVSENDARWQTWTFRYVELWPWISFFDDVTSCMYTLTSTLTKIWKWIKSKVFDQIDGFE